MNCFRIKSTVIVCIFSYIALKKKTSNKTLKCLYTNADQFVNKRDALLTVIADDQPEIILITEAIPKSQIQPITDALLHMEGYDCLFNFDPDKSNLGTSGIRGVAIYIYKISTASEQH